MLIKQQKKFEKMIIKSFFSNLFSIKFKTNQNNNLSWKIRNVNKNSEIKSKVIEIDKHYDILCKFISKLVIWFEKLKFIKIEKFDFKIQNYLKKIWNFILKFEILF
jgi:hypothetical protein